MKRAIVPAGVLVLLLAVAGCTSTTTAGTVSVTPSASGTYSDGDATVAVEPNEAPAAPVDVTSTPTSKETSGDARKFLVQMQLALDNWGVTMNAEQVSSASNYVCDELAAGVEPSGIVAISGDVPDYANGDFVELVGQGYCPVR